jgi:hypothetical protein
MQSPGNQLRSPAGSHRCGVLRKVSMENDCARELDNFLLLLVYILPKNIESIVLHAKKWEGQYMGFSKMDGLLL